MSRIFASLAAEGGPPDRLMIDATPLKAPGLRRACSKKKGSFSLYRRTKGGLNSKLHVVCDGQGKPLILLLTEGQMSDHKGRG